MKSSLALLSFVWSIDAFQSQGLNVVRNRIQIICQKHSCLQIQMKSSSSIDSDIAMTKKNGSDRRRLGDIQQPISNHRTSLSSATLEDIDFLQEATGKIFLPQSKATLTESGNFDALAKVLSASLLITGNTVGSGLFTLPEAVGGVGMVWGTGIFFCLYVYNLISGLILADVAIKLHESSDCEVPSSFKDFADAALENESAGNAIGTASLVMNSCVLAYAVVHAGQLVVSIFPGLGLDPTMAAAAFTAVIAGFSVTQTNEGLEKIANVAVLCLFSSFASILLPSLANVNDPTGTMLAPGTHPGGFAAAMAEAIPLQLSCVIFQNIVPSVTKLLNFDRTKSTAAIILGSFIPMAMYVAWCFAVLGGGLKGSIASGGGAVFTAFSASALVGSCVASVMSLAEEYESILSGVTQRDEPCSLNDRFSVPAVALSIVPPALAGVAFSGGGDFTGALHFAGAFISPFLYGVLPMVLMQKMQSKDDASNTNVPNLSQLLLGAGTLGFICQEIFQDVGNFMA